MSEKTIALLQSLLWAVQDMERRITLTLVLADPDPRVLSTPLLKLALATLLLRNQLARDTE